MTLYQVVTFGTQTLHNGSTHFAAQYVDITSKAKLDIMELANGALFDPNQTNNAVTIPQPFTSTHVIKLASAAAANTELKAIKALVGKRDTLTAVPYDGSTAESCTARLEKIDAIQKLQAPTNILRVKFYFVPLESMS